MKNQLPVNPPEPDLHPSEGPANDYSKEVIESLDLHPNKKEIFPTLIKPAIFFVIAAAVLTGLVYFAAGYLMRDRTSKKPVSNDGTPTLMTEQVEPNITLETGYALRVPDSWTAKISSFGPHYFSGRFFLDGQDPKTTYIEIESIVSTVPITKTSLMADGLQEQRKTRALDYAFFEGKEMFGNSSRLVSEAVFFKGGKSLSVTLFRQPDDSQSSAQFNNLLESISAGNIIGVRRFGIRGALAQETIAGFPKEKFIRIAVMADPREAKIGGKDTAYKDGFARFYSFEAFKGQRLTTVAREDIGSVESYVRTELYDEMGNPVDDDADTRITFNAPYTGTYYYIVRTFGGREGACLIKIFDHDQTDNLVYVKYPDGSEKLADPEEGVLFGESEVAILVQFTNPVEVLDNGHVRYEAKAREFETPLGVVETPIEVFGRKEAYADMLINGSVLPESDKRNLLKIKLTRVSPSKILIEPEDGGFFPKNYHLVVVEQLMGIRRVFTENHLAAPTPKPTILMDSKPTYPELP